MKKAILILCTIMFWHCLQGQESWDLVRCIRHALEYNLDIRQSDLVLQRSMIDLREAKHSRFPSLNAASNIGINFGRTINPNTNQFETENSLFQSVSLSSGLPLFAAGRVNNSINQTMLESQAAGEDLAQIKNNLALQVASTYLNILLADENLVNARSRLQLAQQQLDQMDILIEAGSRPQGDRYELAAQVAGARHDIVIVQNDYDQNLLTLKHLLKLDPGYPMNIEKPEIDMDNIERLEMTSFEAIYNVALGNQPDIRASELRQESADIAVDVARSFMFPTLSLGASLGTTYSDVAQRITGFTVERVPIPGVFINQELVQYEVEQQIPAGIEDIPYFTQFDNNLGYGVSLSLNIPIYNNYNSRANLERARLSAVQAGYADEQLKQTLKTNIQTALSAARSSRQAMEAAEISLEASQIAYDHINRRFDLGTANSYELIQAQNGLDQARISLSVAKYDYIFRIKVLEYYLGRGLTLDDY